MTSGGIWRAPKHSSDVLVLHADDDEADAFAIRRALRKCGHAHRYERVASGEALLDALGSTGDPTASAASERCIVLLDLRMPGMGGLEALRRLRDDVAFPPHPVIVMSGSDDERDVAACYAAGANAYFAKPSTADDLQALTHTIGAHWLDAVALPAPRALGDRTFRPRH